jgi:transposase
MEPATTKPRTAYTGDVSDAEWDFCRPYLVLMREDAPQRNYSLRELFNALRYIVRCGCQWRMMPHDLPPWQNVYQQAQRWMKACCFEAMAHDLRELSRLAKGRKAQPTAAIMDGRTLQSSPESGSRAGYDGYKRRKGSKVHIAVDTLGHLLAVKVTAANEQERAQVGELAEHIQLATGENVQLAYVDHRLHWRRACAAGAGTWDPSGSGQTLGGQERLCAAAKALGGGTQFWLGGTLQTPLTGLRTSGFDSHRHALARLRNPHAFLSVRQKLITGSNYAGEVKFHF